MDIHHSGTVVTVVSRYIETRPCIPKRLRLHKSASLWYASSRVSNLSPHRQLKFPSETLLNNTDVAKKILEGLAQTKGKRFIVVSCSYSALVGSEAICVELSFSM